MNITLVMSSSITTTLTMGVLLAVGAAVAYSKLVLVRMNVPVRFPHLGLALDVVGEDGLSVS